MGLYDGKKAKSLSDMFKELPISYDTKFENPCYHCYTGAIGECSMAGCRYRFYCWSKDLENKTIMKGEADE